MGLFSYKKPKIAIVFDVGSSSVGVAAVALSGENKPKLLFSTREQMVFQENLKFERFVASMLHALEKAGRSLEHFTFPENSGKIISVFFASPWYASQTRISKKIFPRPVLVTDKLLHDIQKKEMEDFQQLEVKKMEKDAVILEVENIQVKLNGYETAVPEGKTTSTLETSTYVSIVPENISRVVKEKIFRIFHKHSVFFHTFSFSSFAAVRDIFFHEKNFIFMDISGEVTDISLVRDNVLLETLTFPQGKNFLLRKITLGLGVPYLEALSYLTLEASQKLTEEQDQKVKKIMKDAGEEWLSKFRVALYAISRDGGILPHDVFFMADEDVSKWFMKNIQDQEVEEITLAEKTFTVRHTDAVFLSSFCETEAGVKRDPFLMMEALFLAKLMS